MHFSEIIKLQFGQKKKLVEGGQVEHENIMEKNYNKLQTCCKREKLNFA